ncbi:hypothetical protein M440DRAFT_1043246 [Trichoderma longibrachiatum ATCC 18648]|uniref:Uncharacterized protein n=1 Tax=Trichoderma longibrachiatum ATCC 18648 TaxID=983965 RepID=A0A2T4BYG6_TRILO|nr:hypothetical protein M440DRAFT_1043246 [Trichoderma longibrachiatum ATCC 18648]
MSFTRGQPLRTRHIPHGALLLCAVPSGPSRVPIGRDISRVPHPELRSTQLRHRYSASLKNIPKEAQALRKGSVQWI